jgi:peptidoglycan/LPS O-acetylase OafA/YrhL
MVRDTTDGAPRLYNGGFRPDIEGLRAVAVIVVLLFHADLGPFAGGYIGVDVFFVVSGFLITGLMLREIDSTGTLHLGQFWGRRFRRLLPASALVIVATLLVGRVVLDGLRYEQLGHDGLLAAAFSVNFRFAVQGGDYFAADLPQSPLLHFWSLAVEEQFYLIWPVTLYVLARYARDVRATMRWLVAGVGGLSFVLSVAWTSTHPSWAYNLLPTRMWELLVGAGLAVLGSRIPQFRRVVRGLAGWVALLTIVVTAVVYGSVETSFPGWVAIVPVLATAVIIAAGTHGRPAGPAVLLGTSALQWIGARSYSWYLWHWPVLILAEAEYGPLNVTQRLAALVMSGGLAELSYRLVETPIRHAPALTVSWPRSLSLGGTLVATGALAAAFTLANPLDLSTGEVAAGVTLPSSPAVAPGDTAGGVSGAAGAGAGVVADAATPTSPSPSITTAPLQNTLTSSDPFAPLAARAAAAQPLLAEALQTAAAPDNLRPSLRSAADDKPLPYSDGCTLDFGTNDLGNCEYGTISSSTNIVLFGDSHAAQWFPAFFEVVQRHGWKLTMITKRGCPTADIKILDPNKRADCEVWRDNVMQRLERDRPELVVFASFRYKVDPSVAGVNSDELWREGLDATLARVRPLATQVLLLGDTPTQREEGVPQCVANNLRNVQNCVNDRSSAVKPNRIAVEADLAAKYGALMVPTTDWLCTPDGCPVIVGDILMYRDWNHLSTVAVSFLVPYVDEMLTTALSLGSGAQRTAPASSPAG